MFTADETDGVQVLYRDRLRASYAVSYDNWLHHVARAKKAANTRWGNDDS